MYKLSNNVLIYFILRGRIFEISYIYNLNLEGKFCNRIKLCKKKNFKDVSYCLNQLSDSKKWSYVNMNDFLTIIIKIFMNSPFNERSVQGVLFLSLFSFQFSLHGAA